MTPDLVALGRRAVACKAWLPLAGMLSLPDERGRWFRVVDKSAGAPPAYLRSEQVGGPVLRQLAPAPDELLPDLSDAATQGAVLALAVEAWYGAPPLLRWLTDGEGWLHTGTTERGAAALVAALASALEAAPESALRPGNGE